MKRFFLLGIALFSIITVAAQDARIFRSEFITYDKREDALADNREGIVRYMVFAPKFLTSGGGEERFLQNVGLDSSLNDYNVFLHLENVGGAYTLLINNEIAAEVEDALTPADFMISPWLHQGNNEIIVCVRESRTPQLQEGVELPKRKQFEGCHIFAQRRLAVLDYEVVLRPDSTRSFAELDLRVVANNDFNYTETIQIGYDIRDAKGKLLEYSVNELEVAGRSTDTLRFHPYIYHAYENKWGEGKAPLYKMTLYVKRNGMLWEYIPFVVGFGQTELRDGKIYRFDKELKLKRKEHFNSLTDAKTTAAAIAQLKKEGYNTLCPDYPQPKWFYDVCDKAGVYVIDRANINSMAGTDRKVGGTPSNDPALKDEYLRRVKAMYYRSRNHSCVIGFALGGKMSGNGYNMYKAYQWLKSVEKVRPVIYEGADGEWNNDLSGIF